MVGSGGIQIGWTGKLPCRGDFVTGGARLEAFQWFDIWASEGIAEIREGGGPAADAFLTSDLQRIAASGGLLGQSSVAAVIGPGMDRAARLYPFMIAAEVGPLDPMAMLKDNEGWYQEAEEVFLQALAPDFAPEDLPRLTAGLPSLHVIPDADASPGVAYGPMGHSPKAAPGAPPFDEIFRHANGSASQTSDRPGHPAV